MPKPRRPVADYAAYVAARVAICIVQAVPTRWAFAAAGLLAQIGYRLDRRHRLVASENLRHAYPGLPPREVDRLVRGCYRHFSTLAVEIALLPRKLHVHNWRRYGSLVHGDRVVGGLLDRRPLLVVTAHFGNWELAGFMLGALGFKTYAIARVIDNPHVERLIKEFRQKTGQTIIAKKDDFARLSTVIRGGGKVSTLGDQDAGPRGVFVEFFGRPASAHKAVALLALETDARMVVVGVPRVGEPMKYQTVCEEVIDPRDYAGRPDAVKAITQRYHAALERLIRRHPEQYFWLHRRWKTQPAARKGKPAAA